MKRAASWLLGLFVFAPFLSAQTAPKSAPHSVRPVVSAKSENWKVEVLGSATYTKARLDPRDPTRYQEPPVEGDGSYNLQLDLRLRYLGPAGDVEAPSIAAVAQDGQRYEMAGNIRTSGTVDFEVVTWLMSATHSTPEKRAMKGGEIIFEHTPVTCWILDIPAESKELKLAVADVPPFPLKLTQLY